jgi:hypothetical protein
MPSNIIEYHKEEENELKSSNPFSPAAIAHLNILQQMISRFSGYCVHAKTMCITMVSGVTAVAISGKNPKILFACFFPILLFSFLDAICLSLERQIRDEYNSFVSKIHDGQIVENEVFVIKINKSHIKINNVIKSYKSWSIALVYIFVSALVLFVNTVVFS